MKYKVGDVIRLQTNGGFRVWKITGICNGALGVEDNYQLLPLDKRLGECVGGHQVESLVPVQMLETNELLELV